jgi:uncharacterized membrane protein
MLLSMLYLRWRVGGIRGEGLQYVVFGVKDTGILPPTPTAHCDWGDTFMEQGVRRDASADPARRPAGGEFTTAMVHLYRAEAARANTWRIRLDTTTNWAVVTTGVAISFALGGPESERHGVIVLTSLLVTFFLLLEARRYRHYDIWQTRVHLMESDFFAPLLEPEGTPAHPNWQGLLAADLRRPQYHISFGEALGWRLRRNYVWLYVTHLITWFIKVAIHPEAITSLEEFVARAALGPLPGWLMLGVGVLFNGALVATALVTARLHTASGEIMTPRETREKIQQPPPEG